MSDRLQPATTNQKKRGEDRPATRRATHAHFMTGAPLLSLIKEQAKHSTAERYICRGPDEEPAVRLDERGEACVDLDVDGDRFAVTLKSAAGKAPQALSDYINKQIKQAMAASRRPLATLEAAGELWPGNSALETVRELMNAVLLCPLLTDVSPKPCVCRPSLVDVRSGSARTRVSPR